MQQQNFKAPRCPSCKRNNWLEFDRGYYCQICEYNNRNLTPMNMVNVNMTV